MKDILSRLYPKRTLSPQQRDGVVAARYTPVVKPDVWEDCTTLLFNGAAERELDIDTMLSMLGGGRRRPPYRMRRGAPRHAILSWPPS